MSRKDQLQSSVMAMNKDFVSVTSMDFDDVVKYSETAVRRPESGLYRELMGAFAGKIAALHQAQERRLKESRTRKLVVTYALESAEEFEVTKAFSQYSLVYKHTDRVGGALARTVQFLSNERLIDRVRGRNAGLLSYGMSVNHLVVHNRDYMHLCVSREQVAVANQVVRDDRAMCAVMNAANMQQKPLPMMDAYSSGKLGNIVCGDPVTCGIQARAGVMNLVDVDTNYLQVCCWMRQHGVELNYISFATSKGMELSYDCDMIELNARVVNEGDSYHLVYKDAIGMSRTYKRANHLTLIAKTYERVGEYTFVKEFCDRVMGISTYKITMAKTDLRVDDMEYRSWSDSSIRDCYLINSYELKNRFSDYNDPHSYKLVSFQQPKDVVDKLVAYARRLDTVQFTPQVLMERLRTDICTSVHGGYSMKNRVRRISDSEFVGVTLAVYSRVFTERFYRPQADKYVTGQVKTAMNAGTAGAISLVATYVAMMYTSGVTVKVDVMLAKLKERVKGWFQKPSTPLPSIVENQPFVKYNDSLKPTCWYESRSWANILKNPWGSFSPCLPGFDAAVNAVQMPDGLMSYDKFVIEELEDALSESDGVQTPVNSVECVKYEPLMVDVEQVRKPISEDINVSIISKAVTSQCSTLVDLTSMRLSEPSVFMSRPKFIDAHAGRVSEPLFVIQQALGNVFPGSTLLDTSQVNADVHYGGFDIVAQAVKVKLTTSKLQPMRPQFLYRPTMGTQVLPNVRQTMPAALPTIVKRNLNTTSSVDPMCAQRAWDRTWGFMKTAYYKADVEEQIESWDYIGPTAELVLEWASKLAPTARAQLAKLDFDLANVDVALQESKLMLKGKRKPNLGPSFSSAVKAAQSIQYDGTKRRTAFFSPLFAEKVRRDKAVLRDDVIIMQSKSVGDLNDRLSCFDWRPTAAGELKYLMLDGEMFDKSQVLSTLGMHWKKSEKFKILPEYVELLRQNAAYRKASSSEAGIQVFLTPQRGSGDSDTLDGNCDVSQAAYARFIATHRDKIEFILIMGDDVTIAFRGEIDIMSLERDCMSEFNLSVKATVSSYGNFVSGWLTHLPDGSIKWVTDPIKRAVALGDRAVVADTNFGEKYLAFKDLCVGLEGYALQQYLIPALAESYTRDLGYPVSQADVADVVRGVVSLADSYLEYRKCFGDSAVKHSY